MEAHIVPGLARTSLISIKKNCEGGCRDIFDIHECRVYHNKQLILVGQRESTTGLWTLPITATTKAQHTLDTYDHHMLNELKDLQFAANAFTMNTHQNAIKFLHQSLFSPSKTTLIQAIDNNHLTTFPNLTTKAIKYYLTPSPATEKGHMKRPRQGIRLAQAPLKMQNHDDQDTIPIQEINTANHIFCCAALANTITGTLYTDPTGRFPVQSLEGHQYMFVAYDYLINAILVEPMCDQEDKTVLAMFEKTFQYLKKKGFKPAMTVLNNQASRVIKEYLETENASWQFVEPNNHRVNTAERAIQTFKNHFISSLCTTDTNFPLQLWEKLLPQAQDTLNLLRTS